MTRIFALSAAVLAAVAVGIASYAVVTHDGSKTVVREVTVSGGTPTASTSTASPATVFQSADRGVVEITVSTSSSPYGGQAQAQGSGFVYDGAGNIITNEHVVEGENAISVRFWNGATYRASLVGTDPSTDVAVIKVNAPASVLHPIALGNSSALQVGQPVVAIGSPYGLENTATAGIVSALHREMTAPNNFTIPDSIQTDAPINHGNSGGPLLNLAGQVIGINAQIKSDTGENTGIGFAVPSNTVKSIVSQLLTSGNVKHAYLGRRHRDRAERRPADRGPLRHAGCEGGPPDGRRDHPRRRPQGHERVRARPGDRRQAAGHEGQRHVSPERLHAHGERHARRAPLLARSCPVPQRSGLPGGRFVLVTVSARRRAR